MALTMVIESRNNHIARIIVPWTEHQLTVINFSAEMQKKRIREMLYAATTNGRPTNF